jgi:DnaJ-domain-containing protein 1
MSATEIAVVLFGLFIGYWLVSNFMGGKAPLRRDPAPEPQDTPTKFDESARTWDQVLGVLPEAGTDDIKRAYKVLMSQYHPDKVATLGDELKALAETKSKAITAAYREAMQLRGVAE